MLYLAYCESANYCGYGQHFVIEAESDSEAEIPLEAYADEYFYEQDSDHLEEDGIDEGPYYSLIRVEEFGPEHESWKYYQDPSQEEFYTKVNV